MVVTLYGCGDGRGRQLARFGVFGGILGEINEVAAAPTDILARAVVFGVVIMIIILKPKGLFSAQGR